MQEIKQEFFPVSPKICLHDAVIESIIENGQAITFIVRSQENIYFGTEKCSQIHSKKLEVSINGCCAQELTCYFVRRYAVFHHAFRFSKGIKLEMLQKMLQKGNVLELIDELYSENQFYWKLAVKPCKRRRLDDEVELSASGVCSIHYKWTNN